MRYTSSILALLLGLGIYGVSPSLPASVPSRPRPPMPTKAKAGPPVRAAAMTTTTPVTMTVPQTKAAAMTTTSPRPATMTAPPIRAAATTDFASRTATTTNASDHNAWPCLSLPAKRGGCGAQARRVGSGPRGRIPSITSGKAGAHHLLQWLRGNRIQTFPLPRREDRIACIGLSAGEDDHGCSSRHGESPKECSRQWNQV